jgi:hypothetical protein
MPGLLFEDQAPVPASAPNRMDVALFAGFVPMRPAADIPTRVRRWLDERGWVSAPYGRPLAGLQDLPVPIDDWGQFDALFRWEQRSGRPRRRRHLSGRGGALLLRAGRTTLLRGAGRRSVAVGDAAHRSRRDRRPLAAVAKLIPGYPFGLSPSPADRASWRGVGHLFGLPDVSFVCPAGSARRRRGGSHPRAASDSSARTDRGVRGCSDPVPPPPPTGRCAASARRAATRKGYRHWAKAIELLTEMIKRYRHETQLVAAVPLSDGRLAIDLAPRPPMSTWRILDTHPGLRRTARTAREPRRRPGGILARNALSRGTFRSAANLHVADVYDVDPRSRPLSQEQERLIERVALIGPTPAGLRLLSDVTLSGNESYRPGGVSRLISTIVRTARGWARR